MKTNNYLGVSCRASRIGDQKLNGAWATQSQRLGVGFGALLSLGAFTLLPSRLEAQCAQWEVSGTWILQQSNGIPVQMELRQNGKTVTGSASYGYQISEAPPLGFLGRVGSSAATQRGSVSGNISGNDFYAEVQWAPNKEINKPSGWTGIYRGKVGAQGRIDGTTLNQGDTRSQASWFSRELMKCKGAVRIPSSFLKPTGKAPLPASAPPITKLKIKPEPESVPPSAIPQAQPQEPPSTSSRPYISATPNSVTVPPGQKQTSTMVVWDGGAAHPYAELWVKVDDANDKFVVEQGKGSRRVTVERGKTYLYILTDSGKRLATVTVTSK